MQAFTLNLNDEFKNNVSKTQGLDVRFSLAPFIAYVREKAASERTAKVNFFNYILSQFGEYPELAYPIDADNLDRYSKLLELIYTAVSPILYEEKQQYWALSAPLSPCIYYGTDAFYQVLMEPTMCSLKSDLSLPSGQEMEKSLLGSFYNLVLDRFYNISLNSQNFEIHSVIEPETKLLKYYRLHIDHRFLTITSKEKLPEFNFKDARKYLKDEGNTLDILKRVLPPENFSIEGISLVTMTDVTQEYALESVKNIIIDHNNARDSEDVERIYTALKTLAGSDELEFGLLPYIELNGKVLVSSISGFRSIMLHLLKKQNLEEEYFNQLVQEYVDNPKKLIFPEITAEDEANYPTLRVLARGGVHSYCVFPLHYNGSLVGCLEVYTRRPNAFKGGILPKIETSFPLLAQLFYNNIVDFKNEINDIITDKFTALQPSVQWRFNEVAYNYLLSSSKESKPYMEPILFQNVHPFYGAVDIKDSSIYRKIAVEKDLKFHFELVEKTILLLNERLGRLETFKLPHQVANWNFERFSELSEQEILKTEDYLLRQVPAVLNSLVQQYPELKSIVDDYFSVVNTQQIVNENRHLYEKNLQMINQAVSRHLDEFNSSIQQIYPSYFEKFRTDGVEFDVYLGQSITPDLVFSKEILHDFRLKQIRVLAEIARTTSNLKPYFSLPLETTQLIFVYEKLIDISFRVDEQRFDVEGTYNIRYQMLKKRIDKAHIKSSSERLVQPGKISIVYFNKKEAIEYIGYINILQQEGLLKNEVEHLEVEELQGVEGLNALRVTVVQK